MQVCPARWGAVFRLGRQPESFSRLTVRTISQLKEACLRANYRIHSWYTDELLTQEFSSTVGINSDIALWAKWDTLLFIKNPDRYEHGSATAKPEGDDQGNPAIAGEVQHYQQKADLTDYELVGADTETKTGTTWTDTSVTSADAKDYDGFTIKASSPANAKIKADGSAVVPIYYDRNSYTVSVSPSEHGSLASDTASVQWGRTVTLTITGGRRGL